MEKLQEELMDKRIERIVEWIEGYAENAGKETLVVGGWQDR